jgi:hypothetical protein
LPTSQQVHVKYAKKAVPEEQSAAISIDGSAVAGGLKHCCSLAATDEADWVKAYLLRVASLLHQCRGL